MLRANSSFASTAFTGAVTVLVFFLISLFSSVEVPPAVSSAFTIVLSAFVGYFTSGSEAGSGFSGDDGVTGKFR